MDKSKLKPTAGYTLIQPEDTQRETASGIVLPDSHEEKPQQGKVLSLGSDQILENGRVIKPEFKSGDTVIYKKWGGNDIKLSDGKEYMFIKFEDILAVVK